jgi:hypothetical protein
MEVQEVGLYIVFWLGKLLKTALWKNEKAMREKKSLRWTLRKGCTAGLEGETVAASESRVQWLTLVLAVLNLRFYQRIKGEVIPLLERHAVKA